MAVLVASIDGPDLAGKTTVATLTTYLLRKNNKNIKFRRTELPSNLVTGSLVDLLRNSADKISPEVFALAYSLDHLHHYQSFIKPIQELKEDCVIIQERSLLTLLIYQGLVGKVDLNWIRELNKFNKNIPNLTLILRINIDELLKRKKIMIKGFDEFEVKEHMEKQVKVYNSLPKDLIKAFNVEYVNAEEDALETAKRCAGRIQKIIDSKVK